MFERENRGRSGVLQVDMRPDAIAVAHHRELARPHNTEQGSVVGVTVKAPIAKRCAASLGDSFIRAVSS